MWRLELREARSSNSEMEADIIASEDPSRYMNEEPQSWKERHFFSLNINPEKPMSDDNPSTLFNLETNPAAYPEPVPGEAPTTPQNKEKPVVEGALPPTGGGGAEEPFREPTVPMSGAPTKS